MTREGLTQALFSLLQTVPGIKTFERRVKHWSEVDPSDQPYLALAIGDPTPKNDDSGLEAIWDLSYVVYLYAHNTDPKTPPSQIINGLLDAIEDVLKPAKAGPPGFPGTLQVLGDRTQRIRYARISGTVFTDEGTLGDQTFAIFPVEIRFIRQ